VQKLLSAAGIGSRREVERWIREGRLQINGEVPALGAKLAPRDRITLDGRPVRLHTPERKELRVLLFHRSPGETLDLKVATSRAAEHLNLPRSSGRWLAIQPMPPVDGGLEILTDDGSWAHRVSRGVHALTIDYVLRMRGPLKDDLVEEFRAATDCEGEPMSILQADAQYGEAFRASAALVGGAGHHREPLDAGAVRAGSPVQGIAARALARDVDQRAQRADQ
jgi:23S rRNA pseudouridine2605 synthase